MKLRTAGFVIALFVSTATFAQADSVTITGDLNWDSDLHNEAGLSFTGGPFGTTVADWLALGVILDPGDYQPWHGPYQLGQAVVFHTHATELVFHGGTINGVAHQFRFPLDTSVIASGDFQFSSSPMTIPTTGFEVAYTTPFTVTGLLQLATPNGDPLFNSAINASGIGTGVLIIHHTLSGTPTEAFMDSANWVFTTEVPSP